MMLLIGEHWLNTAAMKSIFLDDAIGEDWVAIMWIDEPGTVEDGKFERFKLFDGQMSAIIAALEAQMAPSRASHAPSVSSARASQPLQTATEPK